MQPPRDPNDRRFWPAREGGIGLGFSTKATDKRDLPDYRRSMPNEVSSDQPLTAIPVHRGRPAEAVRTRYRVLLELAADRIEEKLNSADAENLTLNELSQLVSATGRVAGINADSGDDSKTVTIRIVRKDAIIEQATPVYALRAPDRIEAEDAEIVQEI